MAITTKWCSNFYKVSFGVYCLVLMLPTEQHSKVLAHRLLEGSTHISSNEMVTPPLAVSCPRVSYRNECQAFCPKDAPVVFHRVCLSQCPDGYVYFVDFLQDFYYNGDDPHRFYLDDVCVRSSLLPAYCVVISLAICLHTFLFWVFLSTVNFASLYKKMRRESTLDSDDEDEADQQLDIIQTADDATLLP